MADRKTELMAQFYAECQRKGYTDMTDDTQSLKAKVIATDLKLNYGNIEVFYEKAKTCYEQVEADKEKALKQRQIQQQKDAQERARRQVNGELLVTLSDRAYESDETTSVRVYIRPDNSVYSTVNNGSKIEGAPKISIEQGGALLLTYHPSQAVYTGATVGGITTGGVHYTQSGYTASKTHSGKGDIEISVGGRSFTLQLVKMSGHTCNLFKRDGQFTSLVHNREIKCYVESDKANLYYDTIKTGRLDHQTMMNALSMAADEQRLSYAMCERIINLLGRIVHGQFPPSDEQIYDSAKTLENASTSAELNRAIELYNSISDYKDAANQAQTAKIKYEAVLQAEKELAILEKEARAKKNKRIAAIVVPILVVLIVVAVIISNSAKKSNDYEFALSLVESGQYADAIEYFTALGDYKDCAEQIQIAEKAKAEADQAAELEAKYNTAIQLLSTDSVAAYELLLELGDYKDAQSYLDDFRYLLTEESSDSFASGFYTYHYDSYGRLISRGNYVYIYDNGGKLLEEGDGWNIEYEYSENGSLEKAEYRIAVIDSSGKSYYSTINCNEDGYPISIKNTHTNFLWKYQYNYADNGTLESIQVSWHRILPNGYIDSEADDTIIIDTTEYSCLKLMDEPYLTAPLFVITSEDGTEKTVYELTINNSQITIDELSYNKVDEHGNPIVYRTKNLVGRQYTLEYENTYDEHGSLIRVIQKSSASNDIITYEYTYGYVYCPDAA